MLLHECSTAGVEIQTGVSISSIEKNEYFHIHTHTRDVISRTVVIACGGTAIPAMGASDFGLRIARQFGLKIISPYPALVPLLWRSEDKHWSELAGLSVYVETSASSAHFKENMLFTHKGLSGPAILQISSYCKGKHPFFVNLSPNHDLAESLFNPQHRDQSLSTVLSFILPQRLAKNICALNNYQKPLKQYSKNEIEHILNNSKVKIDASNSKYIDFDILELIKEFRDIKAPLKNITCTLIGFKEIYEIERSHNSSSAH